MTPRGGARSGAGRPKRQEPKARPIWCGQMSEQDRALILETLTPEERFDALMDAVAIKQAKGGGEVRTHTVDEREREGLERELAQSLIDSQGVATIEDYGGSVRRYREALMELADENGWTDGIDRDKLREYLTYYLED